MVLLVLFFAMLTFVCLILSGAGFAEGPGRSDGGAGCLHVPADQGAGGRRSRRSRRLRRLPQVSPPRSRRPLTGLETAISSLQGIIKQKPNYDTGPFVSMFDSAATFVSAFAGTLVQPSMPASWMCSPSA